jgi:hypothetical protein
MAGEESRLGELRELVESIGQSWNTASKEHRDNVLFRDAVAKRIDQCNEIAAECRYLATQHVGVCRTGHRNGEKWGHWVAHSPASPVQVRGVDCLTDYLPRTAGGEPLSLRWEVRKTEKGKPKAPYLAFDPPGGGWTTRVHRQVWRDVFSCDLPEWIHVDHVDHWLHDCRLSSLQLLPFWLNDGKKSKSQGQALLRQLARFEGASASTSAAASAAASAVVPAVAAVAAVAAGGDREKRGAAPAAAPAAPSSNGSLLKRRRRETKP